MSRWLWIVGIAAVAAGGGYVYLRAHPEIAGAQGPLERIEAFQQRLHELVGSAKDRFLPWASSNTVPPSTNAAQTSDVSPSSPVIPPLLGSPVGGAATRPGGPQTGGGMQHPIITLYLRNGGVVTGEFVSETPDEVILRWDYGKVGFQRAEIERMVKGQQATGEDHLIMPWEGEHQKIHWLYQHEVVVKLMKGTIVDAAITSVSPQSVVLTQILPGGGQIEHTIQRSDIEQVMFRPIRNQRSEEIENNLKTLFPKMQWYEEGLFTIVTDSTPPEAKEYRRTLRELTTDWYFTFYALVKDRAPSTQQYVVVFDDQLSYIDYALTDGVPGWVAVGYFNPEEEALYCFNMVGERFSEELSEVFLGEFRKARDHVSSEIKGNRYEVFLEGQMSEFLQKLERAHSMLRQVYRQFSVDLLRHELTHAMFHNWRLQGIILSKMPTVDPEMVKKKRDYLASHDKENKRQLLEGILGRGNAAELPQMQAANSWYVEGLAGYMEPSPIGGINEERLAEFQEANSRNQILPLEFLSAFRIGSFRGVTVQSALYAYAQSWAMCHFLMQRYPDGFLAYLDRLAREHPKEGDDTLSWLLEAVGKDQRPLEQEFLAYVDQFPPQDPDWLKQWQVLIDLIAELRTLVSRLWGG